MSHTPGPWITRPSTAGLSISADSHIVADVYGRDGDISEREYNAALIAAAPELLKALRAILEYPHPCGNRKGLSADRARDIARVAIAKVGAT